MDEIKLIRGILHLCASESEGNYKVGYADAIIDVLDLIVAHKAAWYIGEFTDCPKEAYGMAEEELSGIQLEQMEAEEAGEKEKIIREPFVSGISLWEILLDDPTITGIEIDYDGRPILVRLR